MYPMSYWSMKSQITSSNTKDRTNCSWHILMHALGHNQPLSSFFLKTAHHTAAKRCTECHINQWSPRLHPLIHSLMPKQLICHFHCWLGKLQSLWFGWKCCILIGVTYYFSLPRVSKHHILVTVILHNEDHDCDKWTSESTYLATN